MPQNRSSAHVVQDSYCVPFLVRGHSNLSQTVYKNVCVYIEVLIKIRLRCDGERVTVMDFIRNHSQLFIIF